MYHEISSPKKTSRTIKAYLYIDGEDTVGAR